MLLAGWCRAPSICPVVAAFATAARALPNFARTKSPRCRTRSLAIRQPVIFPTWSHGKGRVWKIEDGGSSIEDKQQASIPYLLSQAGPTYEFGRNSRFEKIFP